MSNSKKDFILSPQLSLFGKREIIGFGQNDFHVKEMDRAQACDVVRENHYSKTVYSASRIHLGVYAPRLLGVLQFGPAMNPASMASVVSETREDEYCELNRMWLDDSLPRNSESKAISYAFKYLKRKFPKIAWVQSFADERCGRFGVVYQACNFVYCGEHTSVFWEYKGKVYHNSAMTDGRSKSAKDMDLRANKSEAIEHKLRQFRYIYFLRKGFKQRLLLKVKPYPKHESEV